MLDLDAVLGRTQTVAQEVVERHAGAVDREARWPEESLRALQRAGLGGLVVPREAGGLGQGMYGLARVCETLGAACGSTALCFGMHCVGAAVIAAKATPAQRARYLDPICAGAHLTTIALSEPGSGAHFYLPETRLERTDGGLRVDGLKSFVTNGGHADSYVISTVTADPGVPVGEFSVVVVPGDAPGLEWQEAWRGLGMRGNSSRTVRLAGVALRSDDLLGAPGDQIWYVFNVVAPHFLIAMAGTYLGIAQAALDAAREHLTARRYSHTGGALAQQSVLQHRFGTLWATVERTRRLVYHAARSGDQGEESALPAILSAKAEVAACAVEVVNEALTLGGGVAFREESRLGRLLRDARASHVMAPTTDMLRTWTGRALLGVPLLGD